MKCRPSLYGLIENYLNPRGWLSKNLIALQGVKIFSHPESNVRPKKWAVLMNRFANLYEEVQLG